MSERYAANIRIGGEIRHSRLLKLLEAIRTASISHEWGEPPFEPKSTEDLATATASSPSWRRPAGSWACPTPAASTLTADDLDCLRGGVPIAAEPEISEPPNATAAAVDAAEEADAGGSENGVPNAPSSRPLRPARAKRRPPAHAATNASSRGEYERQRTRESKVSTSCVGHEREKHDWWPVGTELVGQIGGETFTAMVVENPQVKSGRSVMITSGAASGKVSMTPTRAAMEATEAYRQAHNLGRGGGVTNGWDFWKPKA